MGGAPPLRQHLEQRPESGITCLHPLCSRQVGSRQVGKVVPWENSKSLFIQLTNGDRVPFLQRSDTGPTLLVGPLCWGAETQGGLAAQ